MENLTITGYPATAPWAAFMPNNGADVRVMLAKKSEVEVFVVVTTYGGDGEFDSGNVVSVHGTEAMAIEAMEDFADSVV